MTGTAGFSGSESHGATSGAVVATIRVLGQDTPALELQVPKLCPECLDSGFCQNRLACSLVCWWCGGQLGFGFGVQGPAAPAVTPMFLWITL
jgi:hypothetical protein